MPNLLVKSLQTIGFLGMGPTQEIQQGDVLLTTDNEETFPTSFHQCAADLRSRRSQFAS